MISMRESESLERYRKEVLTLLEVNFAHDVISVDEYERRVDIALNTSIEADLVRISGDLTPLPDATAQKHPGKEAPVRHSRKDDLIVGILSRIERRKTWNPAKYNKILSLLGRVELDFTEIKLPPGTTVIEFFCVMGHLDIIVPENVRVDLTGLPVMGSIDNRTSDPENRDCPVIKVRGLTLMGSIEARPPRKRRGWRRHRRRW